MYVSYVYQVKLLTSSRMAVSSYCEMHGEWPDSFDAIIEHARTELEYSETDLKRLMESSSKISLPKESMCTDYQIRFSLLGIPITNTWPAK